MPPLIIDDIGELERYRHSRDLSLPAWGPYSKEYAGISHIMGNRRGSLVEFTFVCGYYGGARIVPNVVYDSGYHHWQAHKDLCYYSYRYELEWKDKVYADVEFFEADAQSRLAKVSFHNRRDYRQQFEVIVVAAIREPHQWVELALQPGEIWIPAEKWHALHFWDRFQQDGVNRGVQSGTVFVDGQALGKAGFGVVYDKTFPALGDRARMQKGRSFGLNAGDEVTYRLSLDRDLKDAHVNIRYGLAAAEGLSFTMKIDGDRVFDVELPATADSFIDFTDLVFHPVPAGYLQAGEHSITLTARKGRSAKAGVSGGNRSTEFVIDGFLLRSGFTDVNAPPRVKLIRHRSRFQYSANERDTGMVLSPVGKPADQADIHYALYCETGIPLASPLYKQLGYLYLQPVRELFGHDFERQIRRLQIRPGFYQHYDSNTMFVMYRIKPVFCDAGAERSIYLSLVGNHDADRALKQASSLFKDRFKIESKIRVKMDKERYRVDHDRYSFSQERTMAQLLTNVGYPVDLNGSKVKHVTPGKAWGGLYFWDTGLHALGLLAYSPKRALEAINTYFTGIDDPYHAFIMHGSPVPTPLYTYWEIYQRTGRLDVLDGFYPMAKRMYDFLAGKSPDSAMDKFGNGLLSSYDYFYNAAGWDDYPPQSYIHASYENGVCLADQMACAAFPSHVVRAAKQLRLAAWVLNKPEDVKEYTEDIRYIGAALQKWSWDEKAGYFSYVSNSTKQPLYYGDGVNFNMGLDGCCPLVADIVTEQQKTRILEKLMSPRHLWTPYGLSAVDQSAPYFSHADGYWNGRVWIPYNWFFWKAMLAIGELDFAQKIATTCVNLWNDEVNRTYNLWENFFVATGRGAGCSQFAALSAPVIDLCNAYNRPGQVSAGYDTIIHDCDYATNSLKAVVSAPFRAKPSGVIFVMKGAGEYRIDIQGEQSRLIATETGVIQIVLNLNRTKKKVSITRE